MPGSTAWTAAGPGQLLRFDGGAVGMALNLEEDCVSVVMLGSDVGVEEGSLVRRTGEVLSVPVGEKLIGRVVDALGQPHRRQRPHRLFPNPAH